MKFSLRSATQTVYHPAFAVGALGDLSDGLTAVLAVRGGRKLLMGALAPEFDLWTCGDGEKARAVGRLIHPSSWGGSGRGFVWTRCGQIYFNTIAYWPEIPAGKVITKSRPIGEEPTLSLRQRPVRWNPNGTVTGLESLRACCDARLVGELKDGRLIGDITERSQCTHTGPLTFPVTWDPPAPEQTTPQPPRPFEWTGKQHEPQNVLVESIAAISESGGHVIVNVVLTRPSEDRQPGRSQLPLLQYFIDGATRAALGQPIRSMLELDRVGTRAVWEQVLTVRHLSDRGEMLVGGYAHCEYARVVTPTSTRTLPCPKNYFARPVGINSSGWVIGCISQGGCQSQQIPSLWEPVEGHEHWRHHALGPLVAEGEQCRLLELLGITDDCEILATCRFGGRILPVVLRPIKS